MCKASNTSEHLRVKEESSRAKTLTSPGNHASRLLRAPKVSLAGPRVTSSRNLTNKGRARDNEIRNVRIEGNSHEDNNYDTVNQTGDFEMGLAGRWAKLTHMLDCLIESFDCTRKVFWTASNHDRLPLVLSVSFVSILSSESWYQILPLITQSSLREVSQEVRVVFACTSRRRANFRNGVT